MVSRPQAGTRSCALFTTVLWLGRAAWLFTFLHLPQHNSHQNVCAVSFHIRSPRSCIFKTTGSLPSSAIFWKGLSRTSLVAQTVKRLSTMRETWVRSLGQEDLLEKEMAIYSSTLAWKIPRMEEPGRLQSMGSRRVGHNWATSLSLSLSLSHSETYCEFPSNCVIDRS